MIQFLYTHTHIHTNIRRGLEAFQVSQMVKNLLATQETRVPSLGQEDPMKKEWLLTPVFLPGEVHGQRSLVTVDGVTKSWTLLSD